MHEYPKIKNIEPNIPPINLPGRVKTQKLVENGIPVTGIRTASTNVGEATLYYQVGLLHREDGPALTLDNGAEEWLVIGKRHRLNGPAFTNLSGYEGWFQNDKLHRLDGPAIVDPEGKDQWWFYGLRQPDPKNLPTPPPTTTIEPRLARPVFLDLTKDAKEKDTYVELELG